MAEDIAPEFDLVAYVTPYVERLIKERYGLGAVKRRLQSAVIEYSDLIEELPGEIGSLLRALRQNQVAVQLDNVEVGLAGWSADGELIGVGRLMTESVAVSATVRQKTRLVTVKVFVPGSSGTVRRKNHRNSNSSRPSTSAMMPNASGGIGSGRVNPCPPASSVNRSANWESVAMGSA